MPRDLNPYPRIPSCTVEVSQLQKVTYPSVPCKNVYLSELNALPSQRYRRGVKSQLVDTLHQKLADVQRIRNKSPRNVGGRCSDASLLALEPVTLSEGSIPLADETGGVGVVNTARAQQYRRLIKLVLTRDRVGLIEMGRTVNIPALLGVQHFDPDNFQVGNFAKICLIFNKVKIPSKSLSKRATVFQ